MLLREHALSNIFECYCEIDKMVTYLVKVKSLQTRINGPASCYLPSVSKMKKLEQ